MVELRWIETPDIFSFVPVQSRKKLQYRQVIKVYNPSYKGTDGKWHHGYESETWSDWIDVPTVKEQ